MPKTAQDRVRKGPFAALLILLSLVLGSATAAAGADLRGPSARLGSARHNMGAALLPSPARSSPDDDALGSGPSLLPSGPAIVNERLAERPSPEFLPRDRSDVPQPAGASYRARAPPAV